MSVIFAVTTVTYPQRQCQKSQRHRQKIISERKSHTSTWLTTPYDLEAIAKETGKLDNLKISYIMNYMGTLAATRV